jgi:DNA repair protein RecO (recombination protein O)
MALTLQTDAIVLRSIRYGEADRILHVYTFDRGRVSAIAKGARRTRSRFGARLEPFFEVRLSLHEGRGDLYTVTGADTIDARAGLRESAAALDAAARACDAVARLFETGDPHPEVFTLLANELTLLAGAGVTRGAASGDRVRAGTAPLGHAGPANALAFRLKLLLAAGIVPQLGSCVSCGEREHLGGFSASAGGVVCRSCEAAAFTLEEDAYRFLIDALGRPLADAPQASERALRQAERAIRETAEHHAHVRLRPVALAESAS